MKEDQNEQLKNQLEMLDRAAKQNMTREAVYRYGNVKVSNPEKAMHIATVILQLIQDGKINPPINDETLKELLLQITPEKKEFKMSRK